MKIVSEFKEFALKGNVMDMAVGIIIGAAFTAIVTSLVDDIISPILGIFVKVNFSDLAVQINGADFTYGKFIMAVINFFLIALVLFFIIRGMNRLKNIAPAKKAAAEATTKKCPFCQSEIDINATRCPHCTSVLNNQ